MIAVALSLISIVVMIATGVAASSTTGDRLSFLGVGVQTTTAQVFITGAIFGWVFVIALWLLRVGMHRSGERCAELAARRNRRAGEWLGFREREAEDDGWGGWDGWDEWGGLGRKSDRSGKKARGGRARDTRYRTGARPDTGGALADGVLVDGALGDGSLVDGERSGGARPDGSIDWTGAARHGRSTPWRPDGRLDDADRALASAADQPGPLGGGHPPGPVTGRLPDLPDIPGLGVHGGAQDRQIGGGPGPMPGEDRCADSEDRSGESRQ